MTTQALEGKERKNEELSGRVVCQESPEFNGGADLKLYFFLALEHRNKPCRSNVMSCQGEIKYPFSSKVEPSTGYLAHNAFLTQLVLVGDYLYYILKKERQGRTNGKTTKCLVAEEKS